jgi:hypothetical protein
MPPQRDLTLSSSQIFRRSPGDLGDLGGNGVEAALTFSAASLKL